MAYNFYQGKFKPENPSKYMGNVDNIVYRSSWEYKAFKFCDLTKHIVKWASEETIIPYISPVDGRPHRYFMDLKIWFTRQDGSIGIALVEIKPYAQTTPPVKKPGKKTSTFLEEVKTFTINTAKWEAAEALCRREGWLFVKWTEHDLQPGGKIDAKELQSQKLYEDKMKKAFRKKKSPKVEMLAEHLRKKIKGELGDAG